MFSRLSEAKKLYDMAKAKAFESTSNLEAANERLLDIVEAKELVQEAAIHCQQACQARISGAVTRCLDAVFGVGEYVFELKFEQKRQQTEVRAVLYDRAGNTLDNPINAVGGGCLDVISFGLRLACLFMQRPVADKVLILDEPFKHVSLSFQDNIKQMLEELSEDLQCQIIIISHLPGLQTLENRIEL